MKFNAIGIIKTLDIETRTGDEKIRCKICRDHHGLDRFEEQWIRRDSLKSHEKSSVHRRSLERQTRPTLNTASPELIQEDNFATAQSLHPNMDSCEAIPAQGPSQAECEMWDNFMPTENAFEIERGPEEVLRDARMEFERKVKEFGAWGGLETLREDDIEHLEGAWDEAEHDDIITEILQNLGQSYRTYKLKLYAYDIQLIALENEECEEANDPSSQDANAWHPYSSKLMFLLDTIDNLPHLRISGSLMKVFLWLLKQVGVKHVPSFDALRKVQHRVTKESGIPTINWMSSKGNAFSFNDPRTLIANVSFYSFEQ